MNLSELEEVLRDWHKSKEEVSQEVCEWLEQRNAAKLGFNTLAALADAKIRLLAGPEYPTRETFLDILDGIRCIARGECNEILKDVVRTHLQVPGTAYNCSSAMPAHVIEAVLRNPKLFKELTDRIKNDEVI